MSRFPLGIAFTVLVSLGSVQAVEALTITPATMPQWTTTSNSQINTDLTWFILFGYLPALPDALPSLLYKSEVGAGDSGQFGNAYDTSYSNTPSDPSDALVKWLGGISMDCSTCYLLVKDGKHQPAQYLFNISSWDGTEDLKLQGFWPQGGAISNIRILGTATTTTSVPEPSTLALFGLSAAAFGFRRRRTAI
jgi:hypothetical protein